MMMIMHHKLLFNLNMKTNMHFWLTPRSIYSGDLEML